MKNKAKFILLVAISLITNSCINDFELDTGDGSPLVVIEGQIDNDGNNYIRLTYSNPPLKLVRIGPTKHSEAVPIENAIIQIADNEGYSEIMKPIAVSETFYNNPEFSGFYNAENLIGKPGNTYYLTITVGGSTYTAEAYMPSVSEIDSVGLQRVDGLPGKDFSRQPLIYFSEPQNEKNYYLTKICYRFIAPNDTDTVKYDINCRLGSRVWNFSLLDDRYLDSYINGLNLNDGESPDGRDFNLHPDPYNIETPELQMYSLTKEAFEYYEALIKQFNNDGGIYQPSPASAPSNIKGGALGFFNASAVSKKLIVFDPG